MKTTLSSSQLKSKHNQFKKLNSLTEKLSFWEKDLGINYIDYLENFEQLQDYNQFQILDSSDKNHKDKPLWSELNQWILDNYTTDKSQKYLSLNSLKKTITDRLKTTHTKLEIINRELKKINDSFMHINSNFSGGFALGSMRLNVEYNADFVSYHDYLDYNISPDYSSFIPGVQLIRYANGKTLAQYKIYLISLQKKYSTKSVTDNEGKALSSKQIGLLINYAGLISPSKDITTYARVFSGLLNISYKNLYDDIREFRVGQDKENLESVLSFMKENNIKPGKQLTDDLKTVSK